VKTEFLRHGQATHFVQLNRLDVLRYCDGVLRRDPVRGNVKLPRLRPSEACALAMTCGGGRAAIIKELPKLLLVQLPRLPRLPRPRKSAPVLVLLPKLPRSRKSDWHLAELLETSAGGPVQKTGNDDVSIASLGRAAGVTGSEGGCKTAKIDEVDVVDGGGGTTFAADMLTVPIPRSHRATNPGELSRVRPSTLAFSEFRPRSPAATGLEAAAVALPGSAVADSAPREANPS
jgi:hypothetical protein